MTQNVQNTASVESRLQRHGKVSYLEIPAVDLRQSAAFYEKVFGWNIRGDSDNLHFDDAAGDIIGAWVTGRAISREPGVLPYIYVDGVDKTLERVAANGGEVVRAPFPEEHLWVATFRDPAGNVMGVWQAGGR